MPAFDWEFSMVRLLRITAPVAWRCLFIPVLLAALSAAQGAEMLEPARAARFVESLPGMIEFRDELASNPQLIETGDDPILPFRQMPDDPRLRGQVESHLARHGFDGVSDWRAAGEPLMEAYWTLRSRSRLAALADQMAPLALAVRGVQAPSRRDIAEMAAKLYEDMKRRNRARVPAQNMALALQYQTEIARLLAPEPETKE